MKEFAKEKLIKDLIRRYDLEGQEHICSFAEDLVNSIGTSGHLIKQIHRLIHSKLNYLTYLIDDGQGIEAVDDCYHTLNIFDVLIKNNGWIRTKESLPKTNQEVIVVYDGVSRIAEYRVDTDTVSDDGNSRDYFQCFSRKDGYFIAEVDEVEYWQPLPLAPSKKNKE
ncbi:DUF551 domain-containing protein [Moraxella nasovis]|uniref:DUF551 domain-containing protein n=1 Tax=Moraxella nasovis TaxID=2904121 RepID=UPI001F60A6DE|nr:DUF551 domain-containing protein [Moraxella nasovis]UNU74149.1 DUF551 domain-containing protein [Moraxella nasovis]